MKESSINIWSKYKYVFIICIILLVIIARGAFEIGYSDSYDNSKHLKTESNK